MSQARAMSRPAELRPLWHDTAPPGPRTPVLHGHRRADVLVVGAGYTGLSAALHLAEAGAQVCVLDAHEPGWGASGRNGGQVNPSLKLDPEALVQRYGPALALALITEVSRSAERVFSLIARHGIACQPARAGWLQLGYTPRAVEALHGRARQWERCGVPVELLGPEDAAARTGTHAFAGGWRDPRAGALQPLAFARGLARAAQALGVAIHAHSPAIHLARNGRHWLVTTAQGAAVSAAQVVLATNGYTGGLWPGLASTVLAANSFIVATPPLGPGGTGVLPRGETASTAQRLLLYFRKDAQGRLLMGGRGQFAEPGSALDFAHLERAVAQMFPQLGVPVFSHRWSGRIAITRDAMPHLHQPAPGVTMALGFNGRGIALAVSLGREAARLAAGGDPAHGPYPLTPLQPIPLHGLQRFYVAAGVAWYSLLDKLGR